MISRLLIGAITSSLKIAVCVTILIHSLDYTNVFGSVLFMSINKGKIKGINTKSGFSAKACVFKFKFFCIPTGMFQVYLSCAYKW